MGQNNLEFKILPPPSPRKPLLKMGTLVPRSVLTFLWVSSPCPPECWTISSPFKARLRALLSCCEAHGVSIAGLLYSFLKHRGIIAQFCFRLCWLVAEKPEHPWLGSVQDGWELREVPKDLPGCALECGLEGFSSTHCQASTQPQRPIALCPFSFRKC